MLRNPNAVPKGQHGKTASYWRVVKSHARMRPRRAQPHTLPRPRQADQDTGQGRPGQLRASSSAERPRHQRYRGCGESSMLILAPLDSPIGPSCPAACHSIRASWPGDGRQRSPFTPCYHPRLTVQLFACRCLRGGSPCIRTVCTPAAHLDSTDAPS
jgi:hypothetical protein